MMNMLQIDLEESLVWLNAVSINIDSSSVKDHSRRDWIRRIWKTKKRYLKIHLAVGMKTMQVDSMDVSSEEVADRKRLERLVTGANERVRV
jgi:hypothetical protein